jgi:hypothetical protein
MNAFGVVGGVQTGTRDLGRRVLIIEMQGVLGQQAAVGDPEPEYLIDRSVYKDTVERSSTDR